MSDSNQSASEGCIIALITIAGSLAVLYCLVRFIKWAWAG
jgi:hypothetical protein